MGRLLRFDHQYAWADRTFTAARSARHATGARYGIPYKEARTIAIDRRARTARGRRAVGNPLPAARGGRFRRWRSLRRAEPACLRQRSMGPLLGIGPVTGRWKTRGAARNASSRNPAVRFAVDAPVIKQERAGHFTPPSAAEVSPAWMPAEQRRRGRTGEATAAPSKSGENRRESILMIRRKEAGPISRTPRARRGNGLKRTKETKTVSAGDGRSHAGAFNVVRRNVSPQVGGRQG